MGLALLIPRADSATREQEIEFKAVLERMESDVLALRDEIERVYQYRCDLSTLDECGYNNYNDCTSAYPNEECVVEDEFKINCGGDLACKGEPQKNYQMLTIYILLCLFLHVAHLTKKRNPKSS